MNRNIVIAIAVLLLAPVSFAWGDEVTFWNGEIQSAMQQVTGKANPGTSTRAIAMMNGAIYDVYQAFNRTNQPLLVHDLTPAANANVNAAVAQAAHDILVDCYGEVESNLNSTLNTHLAGLVGTQAEKDAGSALGSAIAERYIKKRKHDSNNELVQYTGTGGMGHWEADPLHPSQQAWGPGWGTVHTWAVPSSDYFAVPGPPDMTSDEYRKAYDMVKDYGAVNSPSRSSDQKTIGIFWAYDRATMGPPPVLFVRNLVDIAGQTANTPEQNARLFAMASVAMADAAVAAWNIKFIEDFWRPIGAIRAGNSDPNANTVGDPNWMPLGAPGNDPNDPNSSIPGDEDDFTPPFPSYTSGHATMGGALFKAIELFYGTNKFSDITGANGIPAGDSKFRLFSAEAGGGGFRDYETFTFDGTLEDLLSAPNPEYSPDSENALSRVFLGVHWIFDQQDGMDLGHEIAGYVAANRFGEVPEPGCAVLAALALGMCSVTRRRRTSA